MYGRTTRVMMTLALAAGAMAEGQGGELAKPLMVQDAPGYNSWSFVQTVGERIVCAYSRGLAHNIAEHSRGVYARMSTDGGRTWGAESVVVNSPDYGESAIGRGLDNDGAMLLWVRCVGAPWKHELYRSADGVKFEKLAELRPNPMPMQITDVMHIPGVGLMSFWFAGTYGQQPDKSWGTLVSKDNGRTWTQTVMESGLQKRDWPTEQCGVYLGNGRILAIARAEAVGDREANFQFQLESDDFGATWRKARTNIGDVMISTPSLVLDETTGLLANYYYHRGKGVLKRRVVRAESIWGHPQEWPPFEAVAGGSANAHHAGNVNVVGAGKVHYCTYYTGDEKLTSVVLYPAAAPAVK